MSDANLVAAYKIVKAHEDEEKFTTISTLPYPLSAKSVKSIQKFFTRLKIAASASQSLI